MLDPTTLFYWDISNGKKHKFEGVGQWTHTLPSYANTMAESCPSSVTMSLLTNQSTITTTAPTSNISTRKHHLPPPRSMNVDKEGLYVQEDVVISDKDEMVGKGNEDTVRSPLKGSGICITSEVSH